MKAIIDPQKKILLHLWDDYPKCQSFEVFPEYWMSIEEWVHEFSELGVWRAIERVEGLGKEILSREIEAYEPPQLPPESQMICHIMVSMHTISIICVRKIPYVVEAEEYYDLLLMDNKSGF